MKQLFAEIFNENIVTALGWSLFHILWQGFIILILLFIVLRFLYNKSAAIRYNVSVASLLLIVVLTGYNFQRNYHAYGLKQEIKPDKITVIDNKPNQIIEAAKQDLNLKYSGLVIKIKEKIKHIDQFFPVIINAWLIGILFFLLKFIFSFLYTLRLKNSKTKNLSEYWQGEFSKLEKKLKMNKTIRYIESKLVKVPLVLGYLKPVLVIPAEMLTGVPANQIEAIIAHELAHIRRNDYIINVIQTIIETVFFFHPAVWFISSQIRNERENCCDDIALTVCDDSLLYAKALVSVQELSLKRYYSAVAFSGNKKHLLNRIKRMIMKPQIKSNFTDKIIAATIIISAVLALSFTYAEEVTNSIANNEITSEIVKPVIAKVNPVSPINATVKKAKTVTPIYRDTVKVVKKHHDGIEINNNTIIRTYREKGKEKEMKFTLKNGKVTELYVDGKKIPESEFKVYQPEIDETIADLKKAKVDIRQAMKDIEEMDFEQIKRDVEEAMKDVQIDMAKIQEDITRSKEEMSNIDIEEIMREVEMNLEKIKEIDFDEQMKIVQESIGNIDMEEIRRNIEKAQESIHENIDMEKIQEEILKAQQEISQVNMEKIKTELEENFNNFNEQRKEETLQELESKLDELENLELEEK